MSGSQKPQQRQILGVHQGLIKITLVTVLACVFVYTLGLCLLLNVYSTNASYVFGAIQNRSTQIVFSLAGSFFVIFGFLGATLTSYRALRYSEIVSAGLTQSVQARLVKDEWSDSTHYQLEIVAGPLAGKHAIYAPPQSLRASWQDQTRQLEAYVDGSQIAAFELDGILIWCH